MQLGEFALQHLEATVFVRNRGRLDNLALIWLEHTEVTALTADINAYHIGKAGGIDRRRWNIGWTHTHRFLVFTPRGGLKQNRQMATVLPTGKTRASTHVGSPVCRLLQAAVTSPIAA